MSVLDDLGMTADDLRESLREGGGPIRTPRPAHRASSARRGRVPRNANSVRSRGDEAALNRLDKALRFKDTALDVIEQVKATGEDVDGGPLLAMADRHLAAAQTAYDRALAAQVPAGRVSAAREFFNLI